MSAAPVEPPHPHAFQGHIPAPLPAQVIRTLSVLQPWRALLALAVEWGSIVAAIAACEALWHPLVYGAAVIWIGARQHALTVLGHDAAHFRLLPNRRWNDWLADVVTQWPMFLTVDGFRHYHGAHHRFLGTTADGNRTIWGTHTADGQLTAEWTYPKTPLGLALTLLRRAAFVTGVYWIVRGLLATVLFRRSWAQVLARLSFYAAGAWALVAADALQGFGLYWLVPYCTWHIACQYIRLICEHSAVTSADPAYALTRTTLARWWERWLIVPRNIHYHLEHHWYPSVPFYNLPALHVQLMTQPAFRQHAVLTPSVLASLRQCVVRA